MATNELNTIINPNAVTGVANLSAQNKEFYDRTLRERLLDNTIWLEDAQKKVLPRNSGDTISFRKFNSLEIPASKCELSEGVVPDPNELSMTEVKTTVKFYGDHVRLTKEVDLLAIDPVLTETVELLGEQAGTVVDNLVRDEVAKSTNIQYAGSAISIHEINSKITSKEIRKAVRTLKKNNVKPFKDGYFHAIIDPDMEFDLQDDPLWQDIGKYVNGTQLLKGEIGKMAGVRFKVTNNTKKIENDNKQNVHVIAIYGRNTFGVVDLDGGDGKSVKPEVYIIPRENASLDNPFKQIGAAAWLIDGFAAHLIEEVGVVLLHVVPSEEIIPDESLKTIQFYDGDTEFTELKLEKRAYLPPVLPAVPDKEGYTSDGNWYTSKSTQDSTTLAVAGTAISADTKLYAKYTQDAQGS